MFLKKQGIRRFDEFCSIYAFSQRLSSFPNGPSSELDRKFVSSVGGVDCDNSRKVEGVRQVVDGVCHVLEGGPWGPALENALSALDEKPQSDLVIGVLRRLKDVSLAINYFRWCEKQTDQPHCPEVYNSLLMVMARSKNFNSLEQVLEEMSIAGIANFNDLCLPSSVPKLNLSWTFLPLLIFFKFCSCLNPRCEILGFLLLTQFTFLKKTGS